MNEGISVDVAATIMGVSERRVRQLCEAGAIKATSPQGWLIDPESARGWQKPKRGGYRPRRPKQSNGAGGEK